MTFGCFVEFACFDLVVFVWIMVRFAVLRADCGFGYCVGGAMLNLTGL